MNQTLLLDSFDLCYKRMHEYSAQQNIGLVSGKAGLLACLHYLHSSTNKNKYKQQAFKLSEAILETTDYHWDLGTGLSALSLICHWFELDSLIGDQIEDVDLVIEREFKLSVEKKNMDYYYGASGYIFYFLMKNKYDQLNVLLPCFIQQIEKNFSSNNWYTPFYQKDNTSIMVTNIGTPHGITGILLILLIAIEKGYSVLITPIAKKVCDFLLSTSFSKAETHKSFFPSVIKQNGEKLDSGIAWCYGDLMSAYAIYKAGLLLSNAHYKEIGYQTLLQLNSRTDYLKDDLCLCHGYASLIIIYKKIYHLTNDESFLQRCSFWHKSAYTLFETKIKTYKEKRAYCNFFENPSLFVGFPGCFLSLFTWDTENNILEKCLLL